MLRHFHLTPRLPSICYTNSQVHKNTLGYFLGLPVSLSR
jgi:hypothetical protein